MAVPSAVYLGASVLIGIPAMLILFHALGAASETLGRGSARVALARHLSLALGVFIVLAVAALIGLSIAFGGAGPGATALGLLIALAALVALYRAVSALVAGLGLISDSWRSAILRAT